MQRFHSTGYFVRLAHQHLFLNILAMINLQLIVLYLYFQSYSYGGTTSTHAPDKDLSKIKKVMNKEIRIRFFADKSSSMQWNFKPQQSEIIVSVANTQRI